MIMISYVVLNVQLLVATYVAQALYSSVLRCPKRYIRTLRYSADKLPTDHGSGAVGTAYHGSAGDSDRQPQHWPGAELAST